MGVFVNAPVKLPAELAESGVIRAIQLHGQEDEEYIRRLRRLIGGDIPVIQAFSVQTAEDLQRAAESSADYVLLDQGSGGTGKTFDWSLAEGFTRPFLLAGGLGTDNLAEAIERLSPWAVDLSSSLEIDGLKDRDKIIEAVNDRSQLRTVKIGNEEQEEQDDRWKIWCPRWPVYPGNIDERGTGTRRGIFEI